MNRWVHAVIALAMLGLAGCKEEKTTPSSNATGLERFGLVESAVDHPLVMAAIESANTILPSTSRRFAPGWNGEPPPGAILVHAVRDGLGSHETMATYSECGCVLVQAAALDKWLKTKTGSGSALLTVQPRLILSYMLLHEAGHIAKDQDSPDVTPEPIKPTSAFNRDSSTQKERETAADAYAAEAIRAGLESNGERGLAAAEVTMALSQLSWNLAAHRLLDDFGGTILRKPSLFWDAGTSHPNLEWRVLVVNDMVANNAISRQLLEDFEGLRASGPDAVLWQQSE